jgi:sulfoxide reductase heme-binding subunit YedZ
MTHMNTPDWPGRAKLILFPLLLAPASWLLYAAITNQLGPDPAKKLVDQSGLWAFRILLLSLAMTPLRHLTHHNFWIRYRRMIGLFALFYAVVHVVSYIFLLFGARWSDMLVELAKRPYVMVGAGAMMILLSLGVTSTKGWQRRLKRNWLRLHRLVYAAALLVLLHFMWVNKLGLATIWPYAMAVFFLLGMRIWWFFRQSVQNK